MFLYMTFFHVLLLLPYAVKTNAYKVTACIVVLILSLTVLN